MFSFSKRGKGQMFFVLFFSLLFLICYCYYLVLLRQDEALRFTYLMNMIHDQNTVIITNQDEDTYLIESVYTVGL